MSTSAATTTTTTTTSAAAIAADDAKQANGGQQEETTTTTAYPVVVAAGGADNASERHSHWREVKWNGWGPQKKFFHFDSQMNIQLSTTGVVLPKLWPYIQEQVMARAGKSVNEMMVKTPSVALEAVKLRDAVVNAAFVEAVQRGPGGLRADQVAGDHAQRVCHAYGKSHRDLWRIRRGIIESPPDLVLYPESHEQVERIVRAAHEHNVALVPFGGGSNIVGAVECVDDEQVRGGTAAAGTSDTAQLATAERRSIVSLDMRSMNRVLAIDRDAHTATFEVGIMGPELEAALAREGFKLGHDPDSFEHSTLGGWLATMSSGMQSDKYGDIEDMCLSLTVVTAAGGTLTTPPAPRNGAGPTLKHLFLGCEGTLGIITHAVMRIRKLPEVRRFEGFLFPTFEAGVAAIREIVARDALPAMIRLYDQEETALSFNMKPRKHAIVDYVMGLGKKYLHYVRGWDTSKLSLMIIGCEGERTQVAFQRQEVVAILKKHQAFGLGEEVGRTWFQKRYDMPLLRDLLLDNRAWVDVAETATTWPNVLPVWRATKEAIKKQFDAAQFPAWAGCHISHSYPGGCCLYFHFASMQTPDDDGRDLQVYLQTKQAATDAILKAGGVLSHHHGVGFEHMPWVAKAAHWGPDATRMMRTLKATLDPRNIHNPGKLIPSEKQEAGESSHVFYTRGMRQRSMQSKL